MGSEEDKQRAAQQAFKRFAGDVSVFLVYDGSVGSGVIFKSSAGQPVVLTARHFAASMEKTRTAGCG